MDELYRNYLNFLKAMSRGLESLSELNEKKLAAAQADDLAMLTELMKQDQAQSLNFRGLEQTRNKLQPQLGLANVPLSQVPSRFPEAMRSEAAQTVETLRQRYRTYLSGAEKTRQVLEQNLREIDSMIIELGGPEAVENSLGYRGSDEIASPPPNMKTDFRA